MKIVIISIISSPKYGNTGADAITASLRVNPSDTVETRYYHNGQDAEEITEDIAGDFDIYGFSVFETNYMLSRKLATMIKAGFPESVIVFGGQFASMNYAEILHDCRDVDYIVLGNGEKPMRHITEHHRFYREILTGDINTASHNDMAGKTCNADNDTDSHSCFDYFSGDTLKNNMDKTHCLMTKSNICTGHCSFCCSRKGRATYKAPGIIADEIFFLASNYGVRKFFITDDDIFDIDGQENRQRLHSLLDKIISFRMNLLFSCFAKPKAVCSPENRTLISKMSRTGFSHIFLGIDAGNEDDRRLYSKNSSQLECVKALDILRSEGISPRFGMIFFNPYSTLETIRDTYRFVAGLKSPNYYHYGGLWVQLLNGTRLQKKARDDGLLTDDYSFMNTEGYSFLHPEVKEIANFMRKEFIPQADSIINQYNTLSRLYASVRQINPEAERYRGLTERYSEIESEMLREYFYHLYEENNTAYCRSNIEGFFALMRRHSEIYAEAIKDLRRIFSQTPIRKAD